VLENLDPLWEELFLAEQERIARCPVERVDVSPRGCEYPTATGRIGWPGACSASANRQGSCLIPASITFRVSVTIRRRGQRRLIDPDVAHWASPKTRIDSTMVRALVRAHRCKRMLDEGRYATVTEMAAGEKLDRGYLGGS
jgi:hypothetical protein